MATTKRKLADQLEATRLLFTPVTEGGPVTECRVIPHWLYDELLEHLGRKTLKDTTHERVA